jgi:hypothetical protein
MAGHQSAAIWVLALRRPDRAGRHAHLSRAGFGGLGGSGRSPVGKDGRMGVIRFTAQLQPRGPAAAVVLDDGQVAAVGEGAKRFPVVATVNGYTWRTSVARMGGEFLLGLNREVRQGAGVEAGEEVEVTVELDVAPREVEVPRPWRRPWRPTRKPRRLSSAWPSPTARSTRDGLLKLSRSRPGSAASSRRSR